MRGEQAIAMARRLDDPEVLATCLNCALFIFGDSESQDLRRTATEAVAAASRIGNQELVFHARAWLFMAFMEHGEIASAEAELEAAARLILRLRQSTYACSMTMYRVMLALMRGELDDAERLIAQAMAMASVPVHQEQLSVQIFTLRREQERLGELQPVLSAFLGQIGPGSIWRPGLALLHLELDQPEAARIAFEQMASAGFAAIPRDGRWLLCIIYLCEACSELGDAARAAELYELMRPYSGRNLLAGRLICCGSADRHLGMLCATMRNWPDAERHFTIAPATNGRIGARLLLAHTQFDFAAMLLVRLARGDREHADALLRACLKTARELGMRRLETRAGNLLAEQSGVTLPSGAVDDLTTREIEVLRLLAIGRGNADIALVLSISLSTVATHVRNIFAKTGCANRTEAAAHALRHGLASGSLH